MDTELGEKLVAIETRIVGVNTTLTEHGKDLSVIVTHQVTQNDRLSKLEHAKSEQKGYDRAKKEDSQRQQSSLRNTLIAGGVIATIFGGIVAAGVGAGVALLA